MMHIEVTSVELLCVFYVTHIYGTNRMHLFCIFNYVGTVNETVFFLRNVIYFLFVTCLCNKHEEHNTLVDF